MPVYIKIYTGTLFLSEVCHEVCQKVCHFAKEPKTKKTQGKQIFAKCKEQKCAKGVPKVCHFVAYLSKNKVCHMVGTLF